MSEPTQDELRTEIAEILKDAHPEGIVFEDVRLQLQDNLECDLSQRKEEVDDLIMEYVRAKQLGKQQSNHGGPATRGGRHY